MAAAAARKPLMASVKVIWNDHNPLYDLPQELLTTWKRFHPNWQPESDKRKKHVNLGTGGLSNCSKTQIYSLAVPAAHSTISFYVFIDRTKPSSLPSRISAHERGSLTALSASRYHSLSFEVPLETKWCQSLRWWKRENKLSRYFQGLQQKKSGIPQGRQMGVFIVQMWQLLIDCCDTVRVKTDSNRWAEKYCTSPVLGCLLNWVVTWFRAFSVFTVVACISLLIKMCWKAFMRQT